MDLYSLGELVIDFTPGSEPASYIRNPGGAPANAAGALTVQKKEAIPALPIRAQTEEFLA